MEKGGWGRSVDSVGRAAIVGGEIERGRREGGNKGRGKRRKVGDGVGIGGVKIYYR